MNCDELNDILDKQWADLLHENEKFIPLYFDKFEKDKLLYIGLNPSFSVSSMKNFLVESGKFSKSKQAITENDVKAYFSWDKPNKDKGRKLSFELDAWSKKNYPYFTQIKHISSEMDLKWQSVDMFQYRKTIQKDFKAFLTQNPKFKDAQLDLFGGLLSKLRPKLILVANASASELFKNKFNSEFDESLGCYFTDLEGYKVPTFLSSMLTGQRALDIHSRKRLVWHMKEVFKK